MNIFGNILENKIKPFVAVVIFIVWTILVSNSLHNHSNAILDAFIALGVFGIVFFFLRRYRALKWLFIVGLLSMVLRNTIEWHQYFFYCFSSFVLWVYLITGNGTNNRQ